MRDTAPITTSRYCQECGAILPMERDVDPGYAAMLRETDLWLRDLDESSGADERPDNENRAIGFLQGLLRERIARLPIFMQW